MLYSTVLGVEILHSTVLGVEMLYSTVLGVGNVKHCVVVEMLSSNV